MMPYSPESTVIRTYLDWLIHLPWSIRTQDNLELNRAQKILDDDHYGLEKPKERITEYLAVLQLVKKIKGRFSALSDRPRRQDLAGSFHRAHAGAKFVRCPGRRPG